MTSAILFAVCSVCFACSFLRMVHSPVFQTRCSAPAQLWRSWARTPAKVSGPTPAMQDTRILGLEHDNERPQVPGVKSSPAHRQSLFTTVDPPEILCRSQGMNL